jgi:hypothetical protein
VSFLEYNVFCFFFLSFFFSLDFFPFHFFFSSKKKAASGGSTVVTQRHKAVGSANPAPTGTDAECTMCDKLKK